MKKAAIYHLSLGILILPLLASTLALAPQPAQAQESGYLEPSGKYSREELAQMLAPVALYPDALLAQVLMASTYPIEVIEADRWVRSNPALTGDALDGALLDRGWDPSVKALCHFPSILALMSERISETTSLGNAFLAQEAEVMAMVQELRAKARAEGNLASDARQKVVVERETIIIEPADPRVIYVPYYDPFYVYGPWWYPAYPPYYWGPPGVSIGFSIGYWPGFYFSFAFGNWCYFDWHRHYIYIDVYKRPRFVRHDRWIARPGPWQHIPSHRRGVAYRDKATAVKYGQTHWRSSDFRRDTRGFPERVELDRGRERSGDARTGIGRDTRREDAARIERDRQERAGVVGERQVRQEQVRQQAERDRQRQQAVEAGRQVQKRAELERQQRTQGERDRQTPQRVVRDRQTQPRSEPPEQARQRVEREQQQRSRDNLFNRVDDGRQERLSSERGRASRQEQGAPSRDWGRSGGGNGGGRGDWGRERR